MPGRIAARDNPFAPGRLRRVLGFDPELIGLTWEELERRWEAAGWRGCITGHHGSGKSSLLDAWGKRLSERGEEPLRLFFNQQSRGMAREEREELLVVGNRPVLVDGWDYLGWGERVWWSLRVKRLLVTRHRGGMRRIVRLRMDGRLGEALLERAVAGEIGESFRGEMEGMVRRHRGNLREVWMELYGRVG